MNCHSRQRSAGGTSLGLVLVIMAISILLVSGVLRWISTDSNLTQRLNQFERSANAAAAATEKVIGRIARDFHTLGETGVFQNLPAYRGLTPEPAEMMSAIDNQTGSAMTDGVWNDYEFTDPQGQASQTYATRLCEWGYTNLQAGFRGLPAFAATYRIIANARELNTPFDSVAAVRQDIQLASIPAFQFQYFYGLDLEIHPSTALSVPGRVHCNRTLYAAPATSLTFKSPVTVSRTVLNQKHPNDPVNRTAGTVVWEGGKEIGVNTLSLPVGTNRSPAGLHAILEIPPPSEPIDSPLGRERYYNKADLIILVSNNVGIAKSGAYNNFSVIVPWSELDEVVKITGGKGKGGKGKGKGKGLLRQLQTYVYDGIVSTNVTFFDKRQNRTIQCTEIDIYQIVAKYSYLTSLLGRNLRTLYVADMRTQSASTQSGVRLVYGETLPPGGLTVATPNPLYVEGDYNAPLGWLEATNATGTVPASVVADAITITSDNWLDTGGGDPLSKRLATNVTVNAAILAGIVPTGGGYYSGGVENVPRLLEDWTGETLTLNGSLVVLFQSHIATAPWGANPDVYSPPQRQWSFDSNFLDPSKLPPSTPHLRTVLRTRWDTIPPHSIQ